MTNDRYSDYHTLSSAFSQLNDSELESVVAEIPDRKHFGIGGGFAAPINFAGKKVFVKTISLCESEFEHFTTRNLFDLPLEYHYGIGSAGFGAWRELECQLKASKWVLEGSCNSFPLLYHWRVLPCNEVKDTAIELANLEDSVHFWDGSSQVRNRLTQIRDAKNVIVLLLEYFPQELSSWLVQQIQNDGYATSISRISDRIKALTLFLQSQRMVHFDAHFGNIMTDGTDLYLSDFGLAVSVDFEMTDEERSFMHKHKSYDGSLMIAYLVRTVMNTVCELKVRDQNLEQKEKFFEACLQLIEPYKNIESQMFEFKKQLRLNKRTPYPFEALTELCEY